MSIVSSSASRVVSTGAPEGRMSMRGVELAPQGFGCAARLLGKEPGDLVASQAIVGHGDQ